MTTKAISGCIIAALVCTLLYWLVGLFFVAVRNADARNEAAFKEGRKFCMEHGGDMKLDAYGRMTSCSIRRAAAHQPGQGE